MAKSIFIRTPLVTFEYPRIDSPDPKFGHFKVQFRLSPEKAAGIVAQLQTLAEENYPPAKLKARNFNPGYKTDDDGNLVFAPKSKHQPQAADAKGRLLPSTVKIGGGSVGVVNIKAEPSRAADKPGIVLRLQSVQIGKLVEYGANFADISSEFGEDAFVADEEDVARARVEAMARKNKEAAGAKSEAVDAGADADDAADF